MFDYSYEFIFQKIAGNEINRHGRSFHRAHVYIECLLFNANTRYFKKDKPMPKRFPENRGAGAEGTRTPVFGLLKVIS